MAIIKIEKSSLRTSVDSFKTASSTLSSTADSGAGTLDGVTDHTEISGFSSAASSIAGSLKDLSKDYKCLSGNLVNYISSIEEIDGESAKEEEMEFERVTKAELKSVAFVGGEYKNGGRIKANESQCSFIQSIVEGAIDTYKKYGVLPSLTIAQAIYESGWGTSNLSVNHNNYFGIKTGGSWDGASYNGWREYNSLADSIEDHGKLLSKDLYKPVIAADNYKDACYQVVNCGYCPSDTYAPALIKIIEDYGLDQWDK